MEEEEEFWKDINLSTLQDRCSSTPTSGNGQPFPATILQDFLSSPPVSNKISLCSYHPKQPLCSLSLNSESDFGFQILETRAPVRPNTVQQRGPSSLSSPVQNKKRALENGVESHDQRHLRLMNNRESAARSRARKEAYTTGLQLQLAHLKKENALLQQQIDSSKEPAYQYPKKRTSLYRTLTAPF